MLTTLKRLITATFIGCAGLGAIVFGVGAPRAATAAEIVNVEYIVGFVKNKWGIDVPYEEEEKLWAANVEYLLKVVDYVNGKLNNGEKTNYGESEYATKEVVDTIAANQAIRTLIKKKKIEGGEFWYITDDTWANIAINGVCGTFTVDWGDGTTDAMDNRDEENAENCEFNVEHNYYEDDAEQHKVTLRGNATKYSEEWLQIAFGEGAYGLTEIGGCLGCIFHTQADGSQPAFSHAFYGGRFAEIPDGLFDGIYGAGREEMFLSTFENCKNLKSIPAGLFSNITAGAQSMFYRTFSNSGITEIPDKLFASIETGANDMFGQTFYGCEKLTTIGDGMFASLTTGADSMFYKTFDSCENLTTIGDGMFASLETGAKYMFERTFAFCEKLSTIGNDMFASLETGAYRMFYGTFRYTGIREIPDNLFASLETGAEWMFGETFAECYDLTKVGNILPKLTGPANYPNSMFNSMFAFDEALENTLRIGPAGKELWEMWPDVSGRQYTYEGATQIPNYSSIPDVWR